MVGSAYTRLGLGFSLFLWEMFDAVHEFSGLIERSQTGLGISKEDEKITLTRVLACFLCFVMSLFSISLA